MGATATAAVNLKLSPICSSLDLRTRGCRQREGEPCNCEFSASAFRECERSAFVAQISVNGRHLFDVLVDRDDRPTEGILPVRSCRDTSYHRAAGVRVDRGSLLTLCAATGADHERCYLDASGATLLHWRSGRFIPA